MNATIFVTYLKECLAPKLKRGDVVIMDNLPVHRVAAASPTPSTIDNGRSKSDILYSGRIVRNYTALTYIPSWLVRRPCG
jgi:hypothetical protein